MSAADAHYKNLSAVNDALKSWRQGDCFVGEAWFAFRLEPSSPVTGAAKQLAADGLDLAETQEEGFVVLTQTCDIVRNCEERPFIEVAPLVKVEEQRFEEIKRGYRPQYAYLPGVTSRHLVVDLDRVMTVEKPVVAGWKRTAGCKTDEDVRAFADAVVRKRARFAFPDDFYEVAGTLVSRVKEKHSKRSPEGEALRALSEIRVLAEPSWKVDAIVLTFYFIRNTEAVEFKGKSWGDYLEQWLELLSPKGRYTNADGIVVTYEDLTAKDYIASDRLDLDHLSSRDNHDAA